MTTGAASSSAATKDANATGQPRGARTAGMCVWCKQEVEGRYVRGSRAGRLVVGGDGRAHWLAVRRRGGEGGGR